jgi:adenylate cyclase
MTTQGGLLAELKRRNVLRVVAAYLVVAWLAIQVVETILPSFGFGDVAVRVVTLIAAIGLVPTIVLAWVFEITPEGIRRERDIALAGPTNPRAAKSLDRIILVLLALAVAYFALDKFVLAPEFEARQAAKQGQAGDGAAAAEHGPIRASVPDDRSIAVLAFHDMSSGKDQEYLSDGLAEELLNLLSKIPDLRVTSRQSAFSFKGKDMLLADVARQLNVAHILGGSVRTSGDRLRITAQLIDARTDTQLWSDTFDRELGDIFAIQEEIAAAVVEQLRIRLLDPGPRVKTADPRAYTLLLQARHFGNLGSADGHEEAIRLLQEALEIDPDYAGAWVALSTAYANQAGSGIRPRAEGFALSQQAAERALEIDPQLASAYLRLGWIAMAYRNDLAAAAAFLQRALELEPASVGTLATAATLLRNLNRVDQAAALLEYIRDRDPVVPAFHYNLGYYYLALGRWDDALASYRTSLRLSPGRIGGHHFAGVALLYGGDAAAAAEEFELEPHETLRLLGRVLGRHALGDAAGSDAALEEVVERFGSDWAYYVAGVLAYRGEVDESFEWLARSLESNPHGLSGLVSNPLFASLRDDPRWLPFLESAGLAPAQLDAIEFHVKGP